MVLLETKASRLYELNCPWCVLVSWRIRPFLPGYPYGPVFQRLKGLVFLALRARVIIYDITSVSISRIISLLLTNDQSLLINQLTIP